jgi:hypothetical protein
MINNEGIEISDNQKKIGAKKKENKSILQNFG